MGTAPARGPSPTPPSPERPPSKVAYYDLLTFYKDNYVLTGFTSGTEVKFQFSAKFDLWPNDRPHALYFGFSEKSIWDLYKNSAPFVENNYNPDLFYTYFHHPGRYDPPSGCAFFSERVGVEHVLRKGTGALAYGSVEVDARWRPPYGGWWRFTPYLYGQFFGGDGETLLNYDHAITAIRVGIGLADRSARAR